MSSTPWATAPMSGVWAVLPAVAASVALTASTPRSMSLTRLINSCSRAAATRTTTKPTPIATHQKVTSAFAKPGMVPSPLQRLSGSIQIPGHGLGDVSGPRQVPQGIRVVIGRLQSLFGLLGLSPDDARHPQDRRHLGHDHGDDGRPDDPTEVPAEQVRVAVEGQHAHAVSTPSLARPAMELSIVLVG